MAKLGSKSGVNKKDKIGVFRLIAWTIATVVIFVTIQLKDYFHVSTCAAPLTYQAEQLSYDLALDKLQLDMSSDNLAVSIVSEAVYRFVDQSYQLCELFHQGRIENSVYIDRQNRLSQQFERLVKLQQEIPAASVTAEQLQSYRETVEQIKQ